MELEQQIKEAGADKAPHITPDHIQSKIVAKHFFTALDGASSQMRSEDKFSNQEVQSLSLLTFCVLVLENGFTVTGESACASPENYNEEIGRKIAHQNAEEKIWLLEGYLLKQGMHEAKHTREMLKDFIGGDCDGCKI